MDDNFPLDGNAPTPAQTGATPQPSAPPLANPLPPSGTPAPAPGAPAQATMPQAGGSSDFFKNLNWFEILMGVVIVTGIGYAIFYYRYKTRQYSKGLQDAQAQLSQIKSRVISLENRDKEPEQATTSLFV